MAKLPAGIAIAAAVHAVLILWWTSQSVAERAHGPVTPSISIEDVEIVPALPEPVAPIAPPVPEPVKLAALDPVLDRAPTAVPTHPHLATAHADLPSTIDTGSNGSNATAGSNADHPDAPPISLGMRDQRHDLTFHPIAADDPLAIGTRPPSEPPPSGELHPAGNGGAKSSHGGFDLNVDRDGTAHISDKSSNSLHLPSASAIGHAVGNWYGHSDDVARDPEREDINNNRSHDVDTRPDQGQAPVGVVGGGFDISDSLMRRHGQDPYASAKLKVLDATRDERAAMATAHRHDALKHATELMQTNLALAWRQSPDLHARHEALFELWDECAESGDADLVAGGQAARAMVVGFIRSNLPASGAAAFTPAELALLNAHRASKATFAPYP